MASTPNSVFLEQYLHASPLEKMSIAGGHILPIDYYLIGQKLVELTETTRDIARERAVISAQSGDSWHDGALNESDRTVRDVDRQRSKLKSRQSGIIVDYPDPSEERVTLGSRVTVSENDDTTYDIVGFASLHEAENAMVKPLSLESPLVKAILGKRVGEIALLKTARMRRLEITRIDQSAVKQRDEELRTKS